MDSVTSGIAPMERHCTDIIINFDITFSSKFNNNTSYATQQAALASSRPRQHGECAADSQGGKAVSTTAGGDNPRNRKTQQICLISSACRLVITRDDLLAAGTVGGLMIPRRRPPGIQPGP